MRSMLAVLFLAALLLAGCGPTTSNDVDLGNGYKLSATKTDGTSSEKCQACPWSLAAA